MRTARILAATIVIAMTAAACGANPVAPDRDARPVIGSGVGSLESPVIGSGVGS
jgi:hypothetical protein